MRANYAHLTLKNTFLNSIDPPLDLRREVTCPAFVVPQTPPKPQRRRWAEESDSDDESVFTQSTLASVTEPPAPRVRVVHWADVDEVVSPTVAPLERSTTIREPEAAAAEVAAPEPDEEWTEVRRKPRKAPTSWAGVVKAAAAGPPAPPTKPAPARTPPASSRAPPRKKVELKQPKLLYQTVPAGVEDGEFKAVRLILGKGGSNLKWISEKTGAVLSLRGSGAQPGAHGPLHMLIKATPDQMERAVEQVRDLFDQIQEDYDAWCHRR